MFRAATPSVLVLDLSLPGTPGQDVCREISQVAPSLPIIILSARAEVMDKVLLLELGAHDYVTKPFSPRELLARVRTAMRRSTRTPLTETFKFGDVKVDFTKMELWREGKPVQMTSQEFKVLKFMIQNAERVLSREEVAEHGLGIPELSEHADGRQSHPAPAAEIGERSRQPGAFPYRAQRGLQIRAVGRNVSGQRFSVTTRVLSKSALEAGLVRFATAAS